MVPDVAYATVESLHAWCGGGGYDRDTFVVMLIDPARAQRVFATMGYIEARRDLTRMRYVPPERSVARSALVLVPPM